MPGLFTVSGYKIFFWSNENLEPDLKSFPRQNHGRAVHPAARGFKSSDSRAPEDVSPDTNCHFQRPPAVQMEIKPPNLL